jgi:membrane associated rhomboid family serine protease
MVGASGAISGVLAAYVLMHPHARVLTVIPIFIFLQFFEVPAFLFIFLWFGLQLLSGMVGMVGSGDTGGGVAWFAHIGGFLGGLLLVRTLGAGYFARRSRRPRWPTPT